MPSDRAQAALDLNAKLRLEAKLRPKVRRIHREVVQEVTRALSVNGRLPDVASIEAEKMSPMLRDYFDDVAAVFDHRLSDKLPKDVAATPEERAIIAALLAKLFDTAAPDDAQRIARTTEKNAREAVRLANLESQRLREEQDGQRLSLRQEALLAGTFFSRALRGRQSNIVMTETQFASEGSKFQEALVLSDIAQFVGGGRGPTPPPVQPATQDWVTMGDSRVRTKPGSGHRGADGQTVLVGEPFTVGGQKLNYPGDTSLGATIANVANCRCSAVAGVAKIVAIRRARPAAVVTPVAPRVKPTVVRDPMPTNATKPNLDADTSLGKWSDPAGKLLPERAALQSDIIDEFVVGAVPKKVKTLHLVGGGTASGKGTVIGTGKVSLPSKAVTVDADEIKNRLPEFVTSAAAKDPNAAAFVHAESSRISDKLLARARADGLDTVLDGTGDGSLEKLRKRVQPFRDAGYAVKADYVSVPTDLAVARAEARGVKGDVIKSGPFKGTKIHRFVPETITREIHAGVSRTFPAAVEADLFDEIRLFDTDVEFGDDPFLIFEKKRGETANIIDPVKYEAFLAKGSE